MEEGNMGKTIRVITVVMLFCITYTNGDDRNIVQEIIQKSGFEGGSIDDIATFDENGKIISLDLSNNDIGSLGIQTLPTEIGLLTSLRRFSVKDNRLQELPDEIGNLNEVTEMNLASNTLTELPVSLGGCRSLQKLDVRYNRLTDLPDSMTNCTDLWYLQMWGNEFEKLPEAVAKLPNLKELYLSSNQLTTFPVAITKMKSLTYIDFQMNKLCELTPKIETWVQKFDKRYREKQKCW